MNYTAKTVSLSKGEFRKERTKYLMIIKYRAKANPLVPNQILRSKIQDLVAIIGHFDYVLLGLFEAERLRLCTLSAKKIIN